jgi:hypothetical protein
MFLPFAGNDILIYDNMISWCTLRAPAANRNGIGKALTIKGKAYIAGIYEHPTRHAPDKSTAQVHAEVARGAIEDAGLTKSDIDGYFLSGDAPGGTWPMASTALISNPSGAGG